MWTWWLKHAPELRDSAVRKAREEWNLTDEALRKRRSLGAGLSWQLECM